MPIQKNYLIGIMDDTRIAEVNSILVKCASMTYEYSSVTFFSKQPIDSEHVTKDITLFQLEGENESEIDQKLNDLIAKFNALNVDYVLGNDDTKEVIVTIDFVGKIFIRFDNIKVVKKGTFKKINELKTYRCDLGYCKGFKPKFRPLEDESIEELKIPPEIIYLVSDCEENLLKFRDLISEKIMELDSDFIVDFKVFKV